MNRTLLFGWNEFHASEHFVFECVGCRFYSLQLLLASVVELFRAREQLDYYELLSCLHRRQENPHASVIMFYVAGPGADGRLT